MANQKKTFKDAKGRWAKASPKQRKIWHLQLRIKAAEVRGNEERAKELKAELAEIK